MKRLKRTPVKWNRECAECDGPADLIFQPDGANIPLCYSCEDRLWKAHIKPLLGKIAELVLKYDGDWDRAISEAEAEHCV